MNNKSENKRQAAAKGGGLVPALRFPEFRDAPEWISKKIGDKSFASLHKGKGVSKADIVDKGHTPCIRYGELYTIYGEVINTVYSRTNTPLKDLFLSCRNDVIIPSSGETKIDIAKASYVGLDDVALGGDLNVIRTQENGVFVSYYLNGPLRYKISKIAQGDSVVHLYPSQLEKLEILLPSPEEQQKIADCLSSLDALIEASAEKLAALKTHKKGLMQQLFPAEGKTLPALRFPEFRNASGWEYKPIKKICEINPSAPCLPDSFIYIDLESVVAGSLVSKKRIQKEDAPSRAQRLLNSGDVIYQVVRPYQKNNFLCNFEDPEVYVASTGYAQLRAYDSNYYLYQVLHLDSFVKKVMASCTGSNYPAINSSDLAKIKVPIPKPSEQQKIAECLSSLDALIEAQAEKLAALKTHKKGLMQQLFPSLPDETKG